MKKLLFLCIFCAFSTLSNAQFVEKFTDGSIQENPQWLGDTSFYQVDANFQLQSMDTIAGNSFIYTPVSTGDSTTWEMYFRLAFNPSGQNQLKVYLASDSPNFANFSGNFNGYFLLIGESLANDPIELFRQDGTNANTTPILSGMPGGAALMPEVRIRVTRDDNGNWSLSSDYTGGTNFMLEDTGFDDTYPTGQFFGIGCKYSSTNRENFFFDDIEIGPLFVDMDGPQLINAEAISESQVDLLFNEAIDSNSVKTIANYSIDNGINVLTAEPDFNPAIVHLTVSPMTNGENYLLTATNVEDTLNNVMNPATTPFRYIKIEIADPNEILINEIYADLNPTVNLPEGKYIELYNRSNRFFNLQNYQLADAALTTSLPNYLLEPNTYVILCEEADVLAYTAFGPTLGLENFPSPNVTGDNMRLSTQSGTLLHQVDFRISWYQDDIKKEGGWSLELINPNLFCLESENWIASNDPDGGSPGQENSVFQNIPDVTRPTLESAISLNDQQILLAFSELLDEASIIFPENYQLEPSIGFPSNIELSEDGKGLLLTYSNSLVDQTNYTITVVDVSDCQLNFIDTENSASFIFYKTDPADRYDILINEIYADPTPSFGLPDKEFVELYNRSDKAINLENYLFDRGSGTPSPLPFHILLPNEYLILEKVDVLNNYLSFGATAMLSTFSLSNSGDTIQLIDPSGQTIDAVAYLNAWHDAGRNEGGFSLERINPNIPCLNGSQNWVTSQAALGGTPGSQNSTFDETERDEIGPELVKAYINVNVPDQLQLFFNEAIDETSAIDPNNYDFGTSDFSIIDIELEAPLNNSVRIYFSNPISESVIYEVQIANELSDCIGNLITTENTARFALSQNVEPLDIVLNEILYNPEVAGSRFIELYNRSTKVIDVIELHLAKRNEDGNFASQTFPEEACLLFPGDYLVLTPSPEDILNRYVAENPAAFLTMDVPSYDDKEDAVLLMTTGSVIIDELQYNADFHNELLDDFNGVSLERIDPDRLTQSDDNWHSAAQSVGFATPTYQNSQFVVAVAPDNQLLDIPIKTVSPDGDGFQDVLLINYQTEQTGFLANFKIFDAKGRLIKDLVQNELLANTGTLKWDGSTNDEVKARIGIYILWGELTHPDGTVNGVKETIVVAGRLE